MGLQTWPCLVLADLAALKVLLINPSNHNQQSSFIIYVICVCVLLFGDTFSNLRKLISVYFQEWNVPFCHAYYLVVSYHQAPGKGWETEVSSIAASLWISFTFSAAEVAWLSASNPTSISSGNRCGRSRLDWTENQSHGNDETGGCCWKATWEMLVKTRAWKWTYSNLGWK